MGVTGLMSLAFMSTVMACANAAGTSRIDWRVVFTPLYIVPFPAFALSVLYRYMNPPRVDADLLVRRWNACSAGHQLVLTADSRGAARAFTQMEDFWTLSFFPSLFISLRMAGVTTWAWRVRPRHARASTVLAQTDLLRSFDRREHPLFAQVVFVPFWIAYVLLFIAVMAALAKTAAVYWTRRETWQSRVYWTVATLMFLMLVVPTFAFMVRRRAHGEALRSAHRLTWSSAPVCTHASVTQILLTLKLDGATAAPWSTVLAPLNLTLAFAFWLALIRSGGNPCTSPPAPPGRAPSDAGNNS